MITVSTLLILAAVGSVRAQATAMPSSSLHVEDAVAWGVAGHLPPLGPVNSTAVDDDDDTQDNDYQILYAVNPPMTEGDSKGDTIVSFSLLSKSGVAFPNDTNPYSYCFLSLFLAANNLLLAQEDDGSCSQTLGADCVKNLTQVASREAAAAHSTGVGGDEICDHIRQTITDAYVDGASCQARRSDQVSGYASLNAGLVSTTASALSTTNLFPGYDLLIYGGMTLTTGSSDTLAEFYNGTNRTYDWAYRRVYPQLAVVIPANEPIPNGTFVPPGVQSFDTYLACPRVTNMTADAAVPSALPTGFVNTASTTAQSIGRTSFVGALLCLVLAYLL